MKNRYAIAAMGPVVAALVACGTLTVEDDLEALKESEPSGQEFTKALTEEYRDFATFEFDEMNDWPDAAHFTEKGLRASTGEAVSPETLEAWSLPVGSIKDLSEARVQLMNALDKGAPQSAPRQAARAQAKFDCWVEQQEENWQWDHIAACRDEFNLAMTELDEAMRPKEPALAFAPEQPKQYPVQYRLYFDFDKAELTPESQKSLDQIAAAFRKYKLTNITIAGHADRAGTEPYNVSLSGKRATKVATALFERDIPFGFVTATVFGESKPLIPTGDGVKEARNRVVVVEFPELPPGKRDSQI